MISRTVLETDFNALLHNVKVYKSYLKDRIRLLAVIKASGYGSGAIQLAKFYEKNGADYLAVAYTNEGIELRKNGITMPIVIFNPELDFFEDLIKYDLEPTFYDFSQFEKALELDVIEFKIHLKLDTGMRRLGFGANEIGKLIEKINENKALKILSIFSHLAASEDYKKDDFTNNQIELFSDLYEKLQLYIGYKPIKHILNSAGIIRFPKAHFDMVRLGIGMHSDDTSGTICSKLEVVHTLKTKIIQIKELKSKEGVGYGVKCIKNHDRKIAILPLGYADGLVRLLGNNRYKVWINGSLFPIIGNVSMDTCFIDITQSENICLGDTVELFGKHISLQECAKTVNTISYEVLSGISTRVKRVYINTL